MRFVVAWLALGLLGTSAAARADEGAHESRAGAVDLAALLDYGSVGDPNVFGAGGGLRAGYVFPELTFYAGALGQLHLGSYDPGEPDVHHYAHCVGLELGYDWSMKGPLHFRPTLRGGYAYVATPRDVDDHFGSPWLGLGGTFYLLFGHFHAGLDIEYRQLTRPVNNGDNRFTIAGVLASLTAGVRF